MGVSSFKDLCDNYDKYKDLSEEELCELIGDWWAHIFIDSKDEIKTIVSVRKGGLPG